MAQNNLKRPLLRACTFIIFGVGVYVYDGLKWHSWTKNLHLLLIYLVIIGGLFWALYKKQQLSDEREQDLDDNQ